MLNIKTIFYFLLVIGLYIIWIVSLVYIITLYKKDNSIQQPTMEEKLIINRIHKYHGIGASIEDEFGNWWFIRNGKKCFIYKNLEGEKNNVIKLRLCNTNK